MTEKTKAKSKAKPPIKRWHQVKAPNRWMPNPGDEFIGTYIRSETKEGQYGEYIVHYIKTRGKVYYVSGVLTNDLFALVPPDSKVKILYLGTKKSQDGEREYKKYELFTEELVEFKDA